MSTLTIAFDTELADLLPQWAARIEQLQSTVRQQVAFGAHIGSLIHEGGRGHREDFWEWLRSLHPAVREDHVRIALKAYHFRAKHPELEHVSQLTFALSCGESSARDPDDIAPDKAREGTEFSEITTVCMRLTAQINRLQRTPVKQWDPAVKRSLKELLRPLMEVFQSL